MRKFRQSPAHCRFPNRRTRNILGCADQISGTERLADGGDVAECRRQMIPFITTDEEKRHLPPGERCGYIIHRFAIQISIQERTVKRRAFDDSQRFAGTSRRPLHDRPGRSEEHTSELQSLMRISYAVFCLKKKNNTLHSTSMTNQTYRFNT